MNQKAIEIQIYFEIAMAIGNSLDLRKMLQQSISAYLRKLSCSTGVVLQLHKSEKSHYWYTSCFSIPRKIETNPIYKTIFNLIPHYFSTTEHESFLRAFPLTGTISTKHHYHIMLLPGFGLLILIKSGNPLDSRTLYSLRQLNRKLADSCIACIHREQIEDVNTKLSQEVNLRRDAEVRLTQLLESLEDQVTDRTKDLEDSRLRYKALFDNIQDIYFSLTMGGTILEISPSVESILQYPHTRLLGRSINYLGVSKEKKEELLQILQNEKKVTNYIFELEARDKTSHHFSMNAVLGPAVDGNSMQVFGSLRDITEQKKAEQSKKLLEEKLLNAKKMEALGLLAGGVAHDLNNILSGIVTFPDLLLSMIDEESDLRVPLEAIQHSGEKAAAVVDDLLNMARRGVIQKNVVNLNQIVDEYLSSPELKQMVDNHPGLKIVTECEPQILNLEGSSQRLKNAFMNLMINSAEAGAYNIDIKTNNFYYETPKSPEISKMPEGDYVVLQITDNGSGISEEDQQRIFEPFYTKKVMGKSGTGLGMSVVWGTVEDHNGFITIDSKPDQTTSFNLFFPASRKMISQEKKAKETQTYQANGETVLVVDDSKDQRHIAKAILEALNYLVSTVKSGEKAIEAVSETHYDIILLDMIMERGIDGLDTYRRIRELHPSQKVIIVTGYSESNRVKEALQLGVYRYIRKPYLLKTIGATVQECLQL